MTNKYEEAYRNCRRGRPTSYGMQDPEMVFGELGLERGDVFLDVGCGIGEYALHAASLVGDSGLVYALDASGDLIEELSAQVRRDGLTCVTALVADATETLPIQDNVVDACLVATVLHIPQVTENADCLFSEICRVLKPGGRVAIVECSMKDLSYGPPATMRLSPAVIKAMAARFDLRRVNELDLGFNYLITLSRVGHGHR